MSSLNGSPTRRVLRTSLLVAAALVIPLGGVILGLGYLGRHLARRRRPPAPDPYAEWLQLRAGRRPDTEGRPLQPR